MKARNIIIGIVVLGLLWVVVFFVAEKVVNKIDNQTQLEVVPSPTERPVREDVPELTASEAPTQDVIVEAVTEEVTEVAQVITEAPTEAPTEVATEEPTARPTAAFTLQPLEIASFQAQQQDELDAELAQQEAQKTPEVKQQNLGTYPIRLAIEALGVIAPVLQVQTDPNFDIVTPRDEIGHYALSARLGAGGNTIMVGHVYPGRVFNKLLDAKIGQIVRVTDENFDEHYYKISEIIRFPYETGDEEDRQLGLQYMYDNSEERITLVTCYPEYEWTHRFVVRAVPIDPPSGAENTDSGSSSGSSDNGNNGDNQLPPIDFDLPN